MKIRGKFRDILMQGKDIILDSGWRSNEIVSDLGRFLAALMKKQFDNVVGIEYIAVGDGSKDLGEFKKNVSDYFDSTSTTNPLKRPLKLSSGDGWVWAKKIDKEDMLFLGQQSADEITNKIQVSVNFFENEPSGETLNFTQFGLLGISESDKKRMFFLNYKTHDPIPKNKEMTLSRTVMLEFPI